MLVAPLTPLEAPRVEIASRLATGVVLSWQASYYRAQSLDVVTDASSVTGAKGLDYDVLESFVREPDPAAEAWLRRYRGWTDFWRTDDYRVAFKAGRGWFLINRFGFSIYKGRSEPFDVGGFLRAVGRSRRAIAADRMVVTFKNLTGSPIDLFATNGLSIGKLRPYGTLVWRDAWNVGIVARRGSGGTGFLTTALGQDGISGAFPACPGTKARTLDYSDLSHRTIEIGNGRN